MLVLFFYVPANNQIFQTAESCVGFFIVLAGWLFTSLSRTQEEEGGADDGLEPDSAAREANP
jgi:hypothetical protein